MARLLSPLVFSLLTILGSCSFSSDPMDDILRGTISYPFAEQQPFGINRPKEKFVIRSTVGASEYSVEIPGAGENYDIEIPLSGLDSQARGGPDRPSRISNPVKTDRELTSAFPDPTMGSKNKQHLMNKAFGTVPKGGPKQGPSYSLGIARISELYKKKNYEYALIEINSLLNYYPNSPRLHKMKGTVFYKLGNLDLAEKAWRSALDLTPHDAVLKKSLKNLRQKMRSFTLHKKIQTNDAAPTKVMRPSFGKLQNTQSIKIEEEQTIDDVNSNQETNDFLDNEEENENFLNEFEE